MIQLFPTSCHSFLLCFLMSISPACRETNAFWRSNPPRRTSISLSAQIQAFPDNLEQIQLLEERLVLVVPKKFLLKLYPDPVQSMRLLEKVRAEGIAPVQSQPCQFPFCCATKETRSRIVFRAYAMQEKLALLSLFVVSDDFFSISPSPVKASVSACVPSAFLTHIQAHKQYSEEKNRLWRYCLWRQTPHQFSRSVLRSEDLFVASRPLFAGSIVKACAKIGASTAQLTLTMGRQSPLNPDGNPAESIQMKNGGGQRPPPF